MDSHTFDEFEVPEPDYLPDPTWSGPEILLPGGKTREQEGLASKQNRNLKLQPTLDSASGLHRLERIYETPPTQPGNGGMGRRPTLPPPARMTDAPRNENALAPLPPIYKPPEFPPNIDRDDSLTINSVFENISFLEHFHLIFRQLGIIPSLETPAVLGITSSVRGEGRTLTALGLAQAISLQIPLPILLVEADLNKPTLATDLGLNNKGLSEYLRDELSFDDLILTTAASDLSIILAGDAQADSLKHLRSDRLFGLLNTLTQEYAAIIVDMPPLSTLAESTRLMSFFDQILMVVDANNTPSRVVKAALNLVPTEKRAGVVLNRTLTPLGPFSWLRKIFNNLHF